ASLMHYNWNADAAKQVFYAYLGGSSYWRVKSSGVWGAWQKYWTNTNDGSGSGLDADLLRGVHWGNVNTNIITSHGVFAARGTFGSISDPLRLYGSGTGASNINIISFFESNGTNRQAYVGFDTNSNFVIANELS